MYTNGVKNLKLIVFSDSHDTHNILPLVYEADKIKPDMFIFLGDRVEDIKSLMDDKILYVKGNGDFLQNAPELVVTNIAGKKVMLTHGHRYSVKSSLYQLTAAAREQQADIVFFGHTHMPVYYEEENIHYCNPGALKDGEYAVCEIDGERIRVVHRKLNNEML